MHADMVKADSVRVLLVMLDPDKVQLRSWPAFCCRRSAKDIRLSFLPESIICRENLGPRSETHLTAGLDVPLLLRTKTCCKGFTACPRGVIAAIAAEFARTRWRSKDKVVPHVGVCVGLSHMKITNVTLMQKECKGCF